MFRYEYTHDTDYLRLVSVSCSPVKNKILFRRAKLVTIQAAIRGYRAKKEFRPRIRGMMKIKTLYDQLMPMKEMVGQLKKDKDGAIKKIGSLEKDMDASLLRIQVRLKRASLGHTNLINWITNWDLENDGRRRGQNKIKILKM